MDIKPSAALGPFSDWTVPQRWFAHFYLLGSVWNILVATYFLSCAHFSTFSSPSQAAFVTVLALLQIHLVRRYLETVQLMNYPIGAEMHAVAYLFGISYYLVVPLSVLPNASFMSIYDTCIQKGWVHGGVEGIKSLGSGISVLPKSLSPLSTLESEETLVCLFVCLFVCLLVYIVYIGTYTIEQFYFYFVLQGVVVFLLGSALQFHSHLLLSRLSSTKQRRRHSTTTSTTTSTTSVRPRYRIPRGGAFEYVSCPHYLGEIVIYFGLALVVGSKEAVVGPTLMVAWVVSESNLR